MMIHLTYCTAYLNAEEMAFGFNFEDTIFFPFCTYTRTIQRFFAA